MVMVMVDHNSNGDDDDVEVKDPSILQTNRSLCSLTTSLGLTLTTLSLSQLTLLIYWWWWWWWWWSWWLSVVEMASVFGGGGVFVSPFNVRACQNWLFYTILIFSFWQPSKNCFYLAVSTTNWAMLTKWWEMIGRTWVENETLELSFSKQDLNHYISTFCLNHEILNFEICNWIREMYQQFHDWMKTFKYNSFPLQKRLFTIVPLNWKTHKKP